MVSRRGIVLLMLATALAAGCGAGLRPHTVAVHTTPGEAAGADRVLVLFDPLALDAFTRSVLTETIRLEGAAPDTTTFVRAFAAAVTAELDSAGVAGRIRLGARDDQTAVETTDIVVLIENVRAFGSPVTGAKAAERVYRVSSLDLEARVPSRTPGAQPAWRAYVQADLGADTVESLARAMAGAIVDGLAADAVIQVMPREPRS